MVVDSHCHLDGAVFDSDRDEVIERARAAGVCCLVNQVEFLGLAGALATV